MFPALQPFQLLLRDLFRLRNLYRTALSGIQHQYPIKTHYAAMHGSKENL